MLSENLSLGQLVRASCGRDEGKYFFIIKKVDESFVLISDGKSRKLDKPKLKKIKHLIVEINLTCEMEVWLVNGQKGCN